MSMGRAKGCSGPALNICGPSLGWPKPSESITYVRPGPTLGPEENKRIIIIISTLPPSACKVRNRKKFYNFFSKSPPVREENGK